MPTHIKVLVNNVKGTRGCEFLQPNTSLFAIENVRTSRAHLFRPRFEQHRLIIIGILMTSAKNQSNKDLVEKKGKHHLHNEHDHGNPKECIDTVLQGGTMSQADRRLHFLHSSLAVIGRTVLSWLTISDYQRHSKAEMLQYKDWSDPVLRVWPVLCQGECKTYTSFRSIGVFCNGLVKHSACPWGQWSWWWGSQSPELLELALRGVWDGRAEPVSTRGSLLEQWPELCRRSTAPPLDRCKSLIPIISCKIWKVYNQTWTMSYVLYALATKSFGKKSTNFWETTGIILDSVALCFHQMEL